MGVTWRHPTQAPTLCCEFSSMSFLLSRSKSANTSVCARSSSAGPGQSLSFLEKTLLAVSVFPPPYSGLRHSGHTVRASGVELNLLDLP